MITTIRLVNTHHHGFLLCIEAFYFDVVPFACFCFSYPCFWCHVQKTHYQDQYEGGLPL